MRIQPYNLFLPKNDRVQGDPIFWHIGLKFDHYLLGGEHQHLEKLGNHRLLYFP